MGYSTIALQQLNLVYKYPIIFWNTACLTVNAGAIKEEDEWDDIEGITTVGAEGIVEDDEDDEDAEPEKKKVKPTDYGKIASAIGKMQSKGVTIALPDINKAKFSFVPDVDRNRIVFGLKGITRISDSMVERIIEGRPYVSLKDFAKRIAPTKTQMINLIKAGVFDEVEKREREALMKEYISSVCGYKQRITLQNLAALIEGGLVPEEYSFQVRVYNFNKFLKKHKEGLDFILNTAASQKFYTDHFDVDLLHHNGQAVFINQKAWDKIYQKQMDILRAWIKADPQAILNSLNHKLFLEEWEKYCEGGLSRWEMDSISYYYHKHELADVVIEDVENFFLLPEEPQIEKIVTYQEKSYPRFHLARIMGTVLDRNKIRHTVSLLTPDGVVNVKLYRSQFAKYDSQISEKDLITGKKKVVERSWFKRGNKVIFVGMRRGDQFIAKTYKNHHYTVPIYLITNIEENNLSFTTSRKN